MAEELIQIGNPDTLGFTLYWEPHSESPTAAEATRGDLCVYLGGRLVWGLRDDRGVRGCSWTWIELLEYLASNWLILLWEEMDPLGLNVPPERLRSAAKNRWSELPGYRQEEEEELLWRFEQSHNLASALQGAWPAPIWIVRQGADYLLANNDSHIECAASEVIETLTQLGDKIAKRVAVAMDARAQSAIDAWRNRNTISVENAASIIAGAPVNNLRSLVQNHEFAEAWELSHKLEPNELLIAARMTLEVLPKEDILTVLTIIKETPLKGAPLLDSHALEAENVLQKQIESSPWDDGYTLAAWYRNKLQFEGPIDCPKEILENIGVQIENLRLDSQESEEIDAICCWGPRHGPVVYINLNGRRSKTDHGLRTTLVHELCHLLIDRNHALPFVEVLGGRVPQRIEARARAFAAEFLLPREVAGAQLTASSDPESVVRQQISDFRVSPEVIAWQARNSTIHIDTEVYQYLKTLVSDPERF